MVEFLKKLEQLPSIGGTKLDQQILFMESMNKFVKTPVTIAIVNSLKELKGINQKQIDNLKKVNKHEK